jgi:DNA-binding NtrC family response regulator
MLSILVVEDDAGIREAVRNALADEGHHVTEAPDGTRALELLEQQAFDLVVTDVRLPRGDGFSILRKVRAIAPDTRVILMTAYGTVSDAVSAMKQDAIDYLIKPFDLDALFAAVATVRERTATPTRTGASNPLLGASSAMRLLLDRVAAVAPSDCAVLITGESGTGKELVARTLHAQSTRKAGPFIALNCAAFPETLLETELFGHERGAFTGALKRREGLFKAADGGTVFLDEVAELSAASQAKLLRVLQEGIFQPLGGNDIVRANVRVLSATNRDIKELIAAGQFREDLTYRLNAFHIAVPPLRERRGDLGILVDHFMRMHRPQGALPRITPRAWALLEAYTFPGNVRELEHAIGHALLLSRDRDVDVRDLPEPIAALGQEPDMPSRARSLHDALREFERSYLVRALNTTGGRKIRAAELLGISRKALWSKLRAHGLADSPREGDDSVPPTKS